MIEMSFDALDALVSKIEAQITERSEHLSFGVASDFGDYRNRCGYIQAMRDVLDYISDITTEIHEGKTND